VLVVLAFACFPVVVQAETVYEPEQTTIPVETKPTHHKATNNSSDKSSEAHSSAAPGSGDSGGTGTGSSGEGSSGGTGNGGGSSQTSLGNGPQGTGSGNGKDSLALKDAKPAGESSGDDGSSPLVPILIAIAVLAAISIGAVVMRQRRQGDSGGQASPKTT
jgi:cobalamin biosynthesis Mg chelatase CobN